MNKFKGLLPIGFFVIVSLSACRDNELLIPKPLANLRVEFPERSYSSIDSDCPYLFDLASYMSADNPDKDNPCHLDIDFGQFNGVLHLSYVPIQNNMNDLIGYSLDKVREHQVRASAIEDTVFVNAETRVFGSFYEFYGNAATPFQFHFTDSNKHFIRGTVYFNAVPNFDSIYPTLQYVRTDLIRLIETAAWK
jgi:gliding motility-associated lipoprotein GldD